MEMVLTATTETVVDNRDLPYRTTLAPSPIHPTGLDHRADTNELEMIVTYTTTAAEVAPILGTSVSTMKTGRAVTTGLDTTMIAAGQPHAGRLGGTKI